MYDKISSFLTTKVNFHYREVDFSQPWWSTFRHFRWQIGLVMIFELIGGGIATALPFLIVEAFQSSDNQLFYLLIGLLLLQPLMFFCKALITGWIEAQEIFSVFLSANKSLLASDPINHHTRESGKLISKIDKGSRSIEGIYDLFTFSILITVVNIGTALFLFARADWRLALLGSVLISISAYLVYVKNKGQQTLFQIAVDADDEYESISTESIQQAPYVRSLFRTPDQIHIIRQKLARYQKTDTDLWRKMDNDYFQVTNFLYLGLVLFSAYCIQLIQNQIITNLEALALAAIYFGLVDTIIGITRILRRYNQESTRIKDLHSTIDSFGDATYPTL